MDWQLVIAINVMMLSFIALLFGLLSRQYGDVSMMVLHALVVAAGGAALYAEFAHAGTLVGALFLGLIVVPGLLLQRSSRAYLEARYADAARLAKWAARVHPSASMRFHAQMLSALNTDDSARAISELEGLKAGALPRQRTQIELTQARLQGRWEDVLAILRDPANDTRGLHEYEIRALGELGRIDEMVAAYERSKAYLNALSLRNAQLFMLAYLGRPHAVTLLRTGKRLPMHPDFLAFWEAVAVFNAAGRRGEGRGMLERVAMTSGLDAVRQTARLYLDRAGASGQPAISIEARAAADRLERRWQEAGEMSASRLIRLPVTMSLIVANAIMFGLEHVMGGVEDGEALLRLGALWPPFVTENGEWWRLVAALFLHYGVAHFVMNMASLSLLGRMIETVYGSRRMLAIYALGGLGSMATVLAAMTTGISKADFVVGASGAVMALFGAWAARILKRYAQSRDALDRQPAILMVLIVLIQCAVDLSVPQISFTGHISGFAIGFLLGLMMSSEKPITEVRELAG